MARKSCNTPGRLVNTSVVHTRAETNLLDSLSYSPCLKIKPDRKHDVPSQAGSAFMKLLVQDVDRDGGGQGTIGTAEFKYALAL